MTPEEFLERAGPLLLADEARNNLILGLAGTADEYAEARFWLVDGAAALRTPPYNLVLATPRDDDALRALVAAIDEELPGVSGTAPEVYAFAELWGRPWRVVQEQNVLEADRLVAAEAPGGYRDARPDDTDQLLDWWEAFVREAVPHEPVGPRDPERFKRRPVGVWEDAGALVSMCGYGAPTPNGMRIGPVFTPPELRGRGYASALTAEVSRRQLAAGWRFCFLYTDARNPTSNRIYEAIGYRRIAEAAAIAFE
ncbi:MAG: GNAT family N-acetyltransferase [Actinomycetota bacterium]